MAIDALTKAYQNQYDVAIFLLGDRDFIPLVEAVKDTGKKTLMICHTDSAAPELMRARMHARHINRCRGLASLFFFYNLRNLSRMHARAH